MDDAKGALVNFLHYFPLFPRKNASIVVVEPSPDHVVMSFQFCSFSLDLDPLFFCYRVCLHPWPKQEAKVSSFINKRHKIGGVGPFCDFQARIVKYRRKDLGCLSLLVSLKLAICLLLTHGS
jgi:hypothetical protein